MYYKIHHSFVQIWIGLFLSVVACIGCIRLLSVSYRKYLRPDTNDDAGLTTWGNICIYIFATLTNHGLNFTGGSVLNRTSQWLTIVYFN